MEEGTKLVCRKSKLVFGKSKGSPKRGLISNIVYYLQPYGKLSIRQLLVNVEKQLSVLNKIGTAETLACLTGNR